MAAHPWRGPPGAGRKRVPSARLARRRRTIGGAAAHQADDILAAKALLESAGRHDNSSGTNGHGREVRQVYLMGEIDRFFDNVEFHGFQVFEFRE